jgi:hypothetical protein
VGRFAACLFSSKASDPLIRSTVDFDRTLYFACWHAIHTLPCVKFLLCCFLLLCGGCASLPRDTDEGWTEKIRASGILEVGTATETVAPRERELVQALAKQLGARVQWRKGNALELMHALEKRELPVVAAEVRADSPFSKSVGMSRPYGEKDDSKRCLAVAPGQNRLLLMVDKIIIAQERRERGGAR